MDNKELLEEIRMNRKEIQNLRTEFYLFKGKAFGFISVLVGLFEVAKHYLTGKWWQTHTTIMQILPDHLS